jgi:hypothetical protein
MLAQPIEAVVATNIDTIASWVDDANLPERKMGGSDTIDARRLADTGDRSGRTSSRRITIDGQIVN